MKQASEWYRTFQRELRGALWSDALRDAALKRRLGDWTKHLTSVVIASCNAMGWTAVGRGHLAKVFTIVKQEYLALDIMAFPRNPQILWPRPIAVFELENQQRIELIAYALWKVGLIHCPLKVVFCYRHKSQEIGKLLTELATDRKSTRLNSSHRT